jgi:hypothetical protein
LNYVLIGISDVKFPSLPRSAAISSHHIEAAGQITKQPGALPLNMGGFAIPAAARFPSQFRF